MIVLQAEAKSYTKTEVTLIAGLFQWIKGIYVNVSQELFVPNRRVV